MRERQFLVGDPDGKTRSMGSIVQKGAKNTFERMDDRLEMALGRAWVAGKKSFTGEAGIKAIVDRLTELGYDHARGVDPLA